MHSTAVNVRIPSNQRSRRRRGAFAAALAGLLLAGTLAPGASAAQAPRVQSAAAQAPRVQSAAATRPVHDVRVVHEVRTVHTRELGVASPRGIAYDTVAGALLVAGPATAEQTPLVRLSPFQDRLGEVALPPVAPGTLAFDPAGRRLAAIAGGDLVTVAQPDLGRARPPVSRLDLSAAGVPAPAGATFAPDGDLLLLDGTVPAIVRVGAGDGTAVSRIPLGELAGADLRGLARNPGDGLLYVGAPRDGLLHAVDGQGAVQATYDLGGLELADLRAFTFAASADPTDAPDATSLYLADAGDDPGAFLAGAGGGAVTGSYVEASLSEPVALTAEPEPTLLVQTIETSQWTPASPDPAGVAYLPQRDRLVVSDSEVEEMSWLYEGVNLYQTTTADAHTVAATGRTTAYSGEPTGVSYRAGDDTLLVSDDNADRIFLVRPGADGQHGTTDDTVSSFSTRPHSEDPEGVAFDANSGDVFIVDGAGMEVYRAHAGPDGQFGTSDDAWSSFDVEQYGARDPEGIDHDAASDHLFMVDQRSRAVYELTTSGALVRTFDTRPSAAVAAAGVALAPGSARPERRNLWIVDRNVDNGPDPFENDGRMYELSFDSSGNTTPTVDAVSIDQSSPRTDDILTVTVSASDADGDALTYTYRWRKNGVALAGETNPTLDLSVPGNGDRDDVISVRVTAHDGISESDPRTSSQVTIVNSPPAFTQDLGDRTSAEGDSVQLPAGATDADGDALAYEATGLPPDLAVGAADGLIAGTVADGAAGGSPYATAVTVTDGHSAAVADTFTWTVTAGADEPVDNRAPVVHAVEIIPDAPATADTVSARVDAEDPDGDPLTFAYQWLRDGTEIAGATGETLDLAEPGHGDKGDALTVRVTASDGQATSAPATSAAVTVVNSPPTFDQDLPDRTDREGEEVSVSAAASDADGDALAYDASGLPPGLAVDPAAGVISGVVAEGAAAASPYATAVTVSDGDAAAVTDGFTWTIEAPPPPAAPTGLTAAVTSVAVELAWDGGSAAGYHVYRGASPDGPFTRLTAEPQTATTYGDADAPLGASHYQVTAVGTDGQESAPATVAATRRIALRSASATAVRDQSGLSLTRPDGVAAGDLLVAAVDVNGAATITPPAGWTPVRDDTSGSALRQAVYYRVATASEPDAWRWTFSARNSAAGAVLAYRGVDPVAPVAASGGQGSTSSTTITAPSLTTPVAGTLLLGVFGIDNGSPVNEPAGMIEHAEATQKAGKAKVAVALADEVRPAAGPTGERSATSVPKGAGVGQLLVLQPASE